MNNRNEPQFHLHIHEGASAEAVRAAAEVFVAGGAAVDAEPEPEVEAGSVDLSAEARDDYTRRAYLESGGKAKPLLEFLADNPGRVISFPEISEHLGFDTPRSLPGLLGSFGRRAKHRYEGFKPFVTTWDNENWFLMMDSHCAGIIDSVR